MCNILIKNEFGQPYLMTGMLAECCSERMLSDSIVGKKGGINKGSISKKSKRETDKHSIHTYLSSICSIMIILPGTQIL